MYTCVCIYIYIYDLSSRRSCHMIFCWYGEKLCLISPGKVHTYVYMHVSMHVHIYIYIYREREIDIDICA